MAQASKPEWLRPHEPGEELWAVMVDPDQRYGMVTQEQWQNYPKDCEWVTIYTAFSKAEARAAAHSRGAAVPRRRARPPAPRAPPPAAARLPRRARRRARARPRAPTPMRAARAARAARQANAYVEKCWTDMCPKSHRDTLRAEGCCGYDKMTEEEYESLSVPMQVEPFMRYKAEESARWEARQAHLAAQAHRADEPRAAGRQLRSATVIATAACAGRQG